MTTSTATARRRAPLLLVVLCLLLAAFAPGVRAATINVPVDQPTIQAALTAAAAGDTVLVANGTYTGAGNVDLTFGGKDITLISQNGAGSTVIDCGGTSANNHRAFNFTTGETAAAVVQGFTIQNAYVSGTGNVFGGAVYITSDSSPTFRNCVLTNNQVVSTSGSSYGGAAFVGFQNTAAGNNPTFTNCVFTGNQSVGTSSGFGGALYLQDTGSLTVTNSSFTGNSVSGSSNLGSAICDLATLTVTNSILYGDTGAAEIYSGGPTDVTFSDVQGGFAGTGNFDADPLFVQGTTPYDLHLNAGSPAIDAGTTGGNVPTTDLEGSPRDAAPDLGAYEAGTHAVLTGQAASIVGTEGAALTSATVATFTDSNPNAQSADFTGSVTIDWGDATTSAGTVALTSTSGAGSVFKVTGGHTYAEEGSYTITVSGVANQFTTLPDVTSSAAIGDAALSATGVAVSATAIQSFTGQTATFTDADPGGSVSDFTATIDWGDGSAATAGTITQPGGVGTAFIVSGTHTYAVAGSYTVTTSIQDTGGSTTSATSTATVRDNTAPTTTATLDPAAPNGRSGFYTVPVTVTLTATDPDNTPAELTTFFSVDSGPVRTYTGPFTVSGDFQHLVTFYSKDAAGIAEGPAKSVTFTIDTTPPTTTLTSRDVPGGREVTLKDTDNFSGPGGTFYRVDSGPQRAYTGPFVVTGNYQHLVTAYSIDRAGNAEPTAKSLTFTVAPPPDTTPPTTTPALSGPSYANGFWRGPVTVTLNATDNASGVASTFYSVDSGPVKTYSGPFTVSGDFQHFVAFYSVDGAGNAEGPAQSVSFSIDSTPPVTTITSRAVPAGQEVTMTNTDNFSGPGGTFYRVDSGPELSYTGPFVVTGSGPHLVTAYSIDRAANAETSAKSLTFTNP